MIHVYHFVCENKELHVLLIINIINKLTIQNQSSDVL